MTSATSAPSRTSPSAVTADVHAASGSCVIALGQRHVLGREADRVLQAAATDLTLEAQPIQQLVGGAGPVRPDQQVSAVPGRDLRDGPAKDIYVVPGMVEPAFPGRNVIASSSVVLSHHTPIG